MDDALTADVTVLFLFLFLLPGFLGQVVYGYLSESGPQDKLDRVVTAFVLALLAELVSHFLLGVPMVPAVAMTKDTPVTQVLQAMVGVGLVGNAGFACVIAFVVAEFNSHSKYRLLKALGISKAVSNRDVWSDIFDGYPGQWVQVDFNDGSFVIGWPQHYSTAGQPRELFLTDAVRGTVNEAGAAVSVAIPGAGIYISDFSKVVRLQMLRGT